MKTAINIRNLFGTVFLCLVFEADFLQAALIRQTLIPINNQRLRGELARQYLGVPAPWLLLCQNCSERAGVKDTCRAVSLDNIFEAVNTGYVDAAVGLLSITPERQKNANFPRSYIEDGGLALLTGSKSGNKSPQDLGGRRVGVRSGSTGEIFAKTIPAAIVHPYQSNVDMARDFSAGTLDAIIHDSLLLEYMLSSRVLPTDAVIVDLPREACAIAVGVKNRELGEKINKALQKMRKMVKFKPCGKNGSTLSCAGGNRIGIASS